MMLYDESGRCHQAEDFSLVEHFFILGHAENGEGMKAMGFAPHTLASDTVYRLELKAVRLATSGYATSNATPVPGWHFCATSLWSRAVDSARSASAMATLTSSSTLSSSSVWRPSLCTRSIKRRSRARAFAMADGDPIREWILGEGGVTRINGIRSVGGGCINVANRYDTDVGAFFVKTNRDFDKSMFEAEAAGLNDMYATKTIRVPKPFKVGSLPRGGSFIIMECIEFGASKVNGQELLGRKLAEMHKTGVSDKGFGFHMDNTIGSTPQPNPWTPEWATFFRDHRIAHQLELVLRNYNDTDLYEKGQRLLRKIPFLLEGLEVQPCLLHGDLWSGNLAYDDQGEPVILDPACYYGHNEAEFGMSWCANFGNPFYRGYFEVMPKQKGFDERLPLYKLYHYLNHYNLFGSSYRLNCLRIISTYNNQP